MVLLVTSCNKPEKKELVGNWRWISTTGGIAGWIFSPETEGFEAEIVFKGSQFTFYKDGEKVISGTYHIEHVNGWFDKGNNIYYRFYIRFHLTEAQCKKMSEATNGKISLCSYKFDAHLRDSETDGQVLDLYDSMNDGFCTTFVKK